MYFSMVCYFAGLYLNWGSGDEGVDGEGLCSFVMYTLCFAFYTC